jgi:hypothetical protein
MFKRAAAVAVLAASAEAFTPHAAAVVPRSCRKSASCLHMALPDEEPARPDRRALLVRAAILGVLPLADASPASAQFGDFKIPDASSLLGDPRGERPAGLGPLAVKRGTDGFVERGFLSPCDSDNCVSTSDDVYSKVCTREGERWRGGEGG